jgi:hypothetical protein
MLTQDQITEFEQKHGRIAHVIGKGGKWEVVLRPPNRGEFRKFKSDNQNPATSFVAQENLVRVTSVFPTGPDVEALLDKYPGIPEACTAAIMDLAGMTAEVEGK